MELALEEPNASLDKEILEIREHVVQIEAVLIYVLLCIVGLFLAAQSKSNFIVWAVAIVSLIGIRQVMRVRNPASRVRTRLLNISAGAATGVGTEWQRSVFLNGDVAKKVAELKQEEGPDLHIWGSGNLLSQTLMKHDLVDNFWLMIYPITLGEGKRLFAEGTIPAAFAVTESIVGSSGVILVNYERAGAVQTGTFTQ